MVTYLRQFLIRGILKGRQQLEQGAKALNEELARIDIDTDSIVVNDTRSFRLTDCIIDFY